MQNLRKLVGRYPNLFTEAGEGGGAEGEEDTGEDEGVETVDSHWGWINTIDDIANGERKDWDYYLNMNLIEFFNEVAFRKDKKEKQNNDIRAMIKGKRAEEASMILLAYLCRK